MEKRGEIYLHELKEKGSDGWGTTEAMQRIVAPVKCNDYTSSLQKMQAEIDGRFTPKKLQSDLLGAVYANLDMDTRAGRVWECGSFLEWKVTADQKKLNKANFCKDRLCPMCNWRRSLKIFGQVSKVMNQMQDYRFLFLTLTIRNCTADELPETVQALYTGWRYLYNKNKEFRNAIEGTFRSLEVTQTNIDGTYHPHLHCILAVKPSYFKKGYITQNRWCELWRIACSLDYDPIVHIETVKDTGKGIAGAVAEATKYAVKGSDMLDGNDIEKSSEKVKAFLSALSGRKLCGWTGCFARIRKQLELDDCENGDLLHTDDETIRDDVACMIVRYHWKAGAYVML